MSGDPELWNYKTGAEAPQPLWKQSWNIPSGSSLSPRTAGVRSELQNTNTETNGSIKLDLTEKKMLHHLKKELLKAQLMPWPCSYYSEGCVTTVWKRPGDHSRTIMSPPGSLLQEEKKAGLAVLGHDSPHGHFSVCQRAGEQSTHRLLCWPEQLITSSQPDFLCFTQLFPTQEAAVAILHNPQINVFSGLWQSRAQHKEGLSTGH